MRINVNNDDLSDKQKRVIRQLAYYFQSENAQLEMLSREIDDLYAQVEELKEMEDDNAENHETE